MKEIILNGKKIIINTTVDTIGLFCPLPIVMLKRAMKKVKVNSIIELLSDDPGVLEDIPAWCNETGNRLLSLKKDEDKIFIAYVMKERE